MTSLKTKNICFLAAFLFLSIVPTLARVVDRVQDCNQFLYQGTPPTIPGILENGNIQNQNRYRFICQTYNNVPRYLTLYDTVNKIPVFSAYKYRGSVGGRPNRVTWMIEPQLEDNMMKEKISSTNQAMSVDYSPENRRAKDCDRGHLFPASHTPSLDDQISTYTLTNAVPQIESFNSQSWSLMEQCIQHIMDYYIKERQMECFVVVGAKPSEQSKEHNEAQPGASSGASSGTSAGSSAEVPATNNLNNRVNIPSMMWSAFYCSDREKSLAGAHWGKNEKVEKVENSKTLLLMRTLEDLKNTEGIEAFPGTTPTAFDINDIKDNKVKQIVNNNCRLR